MTVVLVVRKDELGEYMAKIEQLPDSIRGQALRSYFESVNVTLEAIMSERIYSGGHQAKQRTWATSYDSYLGEYVKHGSQPLVRSGALFRSLTNSAAKYAIRRYADTYFSFGTSRMAVDSKNITYDLAKILSGGAQTRPRTRLASDVGFLAWEAQPGKWESALRTADEGATIPPRPFLFSDKQMTQDEHARIDSVTQNYWQNYLQLYFGS